MANLEEQLTVAYRDLHASMELSDEWIDLPPAVPFVGSEYGSELPKVLIYGSAENLTHLVKKYKEPTPEHAPANRNRQNFEQWKSEGYSSRWKPSSNNFFPWVHMSPVSDGSLPTVARYLLELTGNAGFSRSPERFLQQVAVVNYGKYSLKGSRNSDYASSSQKLRVSEPFILKDLEIVRPDIVMIPRTIFSKSFQKLIGSSEFQPTIVWRILQTNARVINTQVKKKLKEVGAPQGQERDAWLEEWLEHIRIDMRAYLDWIDWRMGRTKGVLDPGWYIETKIQSPSKPDQIGAAADPIR